MTTGSRSSSMSIYDIVLYILMHISHLLVMFGFLMSICPLGMEVVFESQALVMTTFFPVILPLIRSLACVLFSLFVESGPVAIRTNGISMLVGGELHMSLVSGGVVDRFP